MTWEGRVGERYNLFAAMRVFLSARKGLPVFGLGSKRGLFDDETATRILWPRLKISDVLHRSTVSS